MFYIYIYVFLTLSRLSYLDGRLKAPVDPRSDDYAPLATYRHTLLMGENDTTIQQSRLAAPAGTGRRGRGAKRKLNIEGIIVGFVLYDYLQFLRILVCRFLGLIDSCHFVSG